jgi:uncharacterized membrane protein YdbT with pleckstrin-like domain
MIQCKACGREAPAESMFCPHCGTSLGSDDRPAEVGADQATGARRLRTMMRQNNGPLLPEEDLWNGTYSPKAMFGTMLVALLASVAGLVCVVAFWNTGAGWKWLALGLLAMWGVLALLLVYRRLSVRYRLTSYRFFHERGLLSRTTDRVEVIDIDDVTVYQGLIERMLGVGTIHIQSSDRTDPELSLPGIDEVRAVADVIDNTRRSERERRGLHIESI